MTPDKKDVGEVTCAACPSFVEAGTRVPSTVATLNVPVCLSLARVVTTVNMPLRDTYQSMREQAAGCVSYNQPPPKALPHVFAFAEPDPEVTPAPSTAVRPGSCSGCRHRLEPQDMRRCFGVGNMGCAARGIVVTPTLAANLASSCEFAERDTARTGNPEAVALLPHLEPHVWRVEMDGAVRERDVSDPVADPLTRATDAPVTEEDADEGILAWHTHADPGDPARTVLLPVFDPQSFTDADRAKIPRPGDDEHPELYEDHQGLAYTLGVLWRHLGETPALNGPAGSGKSEALRYMAFLMQLPFERFSITASTELDDLAGRWVLRGGEGGNETVFQYGRLPLAWRRPCVMLLDEPNTGSPEVWQFVRPLTDNSKQMVLDMAAGERVSRHRFAYLGMAFNPAWDIRNAGTHEIADADGSRLMHIAMPYPEKELERQIVRRRCAADGYDIDSALVSSIVDIAADLRALSGQSGALSVSWGTRQTIKVARATRYFSLRQAHRLAAADLLDPAESDQVLAVVGTHDKTKVTVSRKKGKF